MCPREMLFAMSINAQLSYEYRAVVTSRHARRLRVQLNLLTAPYDFASRGDLSPTMNHISKEREERFSLTFYIKYIVQSF